MSHGRREVKKLIVDYRLFLSTFCIDFFYLFFFLNKYSRGELNTKSEIESEVGFKVYVAVEKMAEGSRTPMKTRQSYAY